MLLEVEVDELAKKQWERQPQGEWAAIAAIIFQAIMPYSIKLSLSGQQSVEHPAISQRS
jgi:hypothetical protein